MQNLIPTALNKLCAVGLLVDFCALIRLICTNRFPLNNIAFRLLLDIVRWYSLRSTSKMEYSTDCMKFWKVMYRLFHGKALRFMAGLKYAGQETNESTTRSVDPQTTKINFAVPDIHAVSSFESINEIPREISPGIISQAMDMKSAGKHYVLSFDG